MAAPNRPPNPNPNPHLLNPSPSNPFSASSSQRATSTLFTARPLNATSLNPNPNHTIPHGILYPVSSRPSPMAVQPSAATLPTVAGVNPTVYARHAAPATSHVPQHQHHQHRFAYAGSDVQHHVRPSMSPSFAVPRAAGHSAPPPLKGVPLANHAKVQSLPIVAQTLEYAIAKDRERNREDTFLVIRDRKVRMTDGEPCSLYSLSRSWVKNGIPHENQSNYGNNERLLPRPLPASFVDSDELRNGEKDHEENQDATNNECGAAAVEQITTRSLLEGHIKRAKRIRARLQKERLTKIKRYKQRLALLLPPPAELGNNYAPGN